MVINVDEHLVRSEKDKVAQSKLTHRPGEEEAAAAFLAACRALFFIQKKG